MNLSSRSAQVHITFLFIFRCWEPRRRKLECSTVSSFAPEAGLIVSDRMLPYSLGCALTSAFAGILVSRTGEYRPTMWVAHAICVVGFGVMYMLDGTSSTYVYKIGKGSVANSVDQGGEGYLSFHRGDGYWLPVRSELRGRKCLCCSC